jgi:hypothetical protein
MDGSTHGWLMAPTVRMAFASDRRLGGGKSGGSRMRPEGASLVTTPAGSWQRQSRRFGLARKTVAACAGLRLDRNVQVVARLATTTR